MFQRKKKKPDSFQLDPSIDKTKFVRVDKDPTRKRIKKWISKKLKGISNEN